MPLDDDHLDSRPCERCASRPATMVVKLSENGEMREHHLCKQCAERIVPPMAPLVDLLLSVGMDGAMESLAGRPPACSRCGMTSERLKQRQRMGCPHCYRHFADEMAPMLRDMQSGDRHVGKVPERNRKCLEMAAEERALKQAVAAQNFEKAAELRDKIQALRQALPDAQSTPGGRA